MLRFLFLITYKNKWEYLTYIFRHWFGKYILSRNSSLKIIKIIDFIEAALIDFMFPGKLFHKELDFFTNFFKWHFIYFIILTSQTSVYQS